MDLSKFPLELLETGLMKWQVPGRSVLGLRGRPLDSVGQSILQALFDACATESKGGIGLASLESRCDVHSTDMIQQALGQLQTEGYLQVSDRGVLLTQFGVGAISFRKPLCGATPVAALRDDINPFDMTLLELTYSLQNKGWVCERARK
eukprot:9248249-Alexandrium_andersonii.AAC.1